MTVRSLALVSRLALLLVVAISSALTSPAAGAAEAGSAHPGLRSSASIVNSCPVVGAVVHRSAPGAGKTVALTFDDGPGTSTAAILTLLESRHVKATFFNLGVHLATHEPQLRREVRLGHALGNHGWDHADMTTLTRDEQAAEVDRTTRKMIGLVSVRPCVFRPPYGAYNQTTLNVASSRHLGVWTWSVDPEDWKAAGSASAYWVNRIVARARAGLTQKHPVILLHNAVGGNPATVSALPRIIHIYREHGYRFVLL
jgi:peptidoglycan/xylan/chitin deacetylase (PgdA/CDA1 family)